MAKATVLQNLELGTAGIADELFGTHYAADVYAEQTDPGNPQLVTNAETAEANGAVDDAAKATAGQVADAANVVGGYVKWIVVGLVAIAGIYALVTVAPYLKRGA